MQVLAAAGATFTTCDTRKKIPNVGKGWQNKPIILGGALAAHSRGNNIGLMCGEPSNWLDALDFDKRAGEFQQMYPDLCRWRVWRDNDTKRAKYIVRAPGAWNKKCKPKGLEILSTRNQAVVAGVHETGAPIRMELIGDVPEITVEQLGALYEMWTGEPYAKRPARFQRNPELDNGHAPGDTITVRILLDHIAGWRADDYNEWVRIGFAVKQECGDSGFNLWETWSRQSDKYDPEEAAKKWNSFPANGRVTGRTLYYLAAQDGGLRLDGAK